MDLDSEMHTGTELYTLKTESDGSLTNDFTTVIVESNRFS